MSPANSGKRTAPALWGCIKSKRWRRPSAAGAMFEGSDSSPWASLDEDLLRLVAWRVLAGDFADYIRLRAVCPHWRSSTVCPRGRGVVDPRFHPRHWMLLPEGYRMYPGHTKLRGCVRFFNLLTGSFASVRLPIFRDHFAMDSVNGLLLLQRDHDMAVRLLHPFTGDISELPSLATLLPQLAALFPPFEINGYKQDYLLRLMRDVCAAVSFSPNGVITAMLALTSSHVGRVAFATSEDQQWTLSSWEANTKFGLMSVQGKLYFSNSKFQIFVVDPPQPEVKKGFGSPPAPSSLLPPKLIATCPSGKFRAPLYLVECDSEILLVGNTCFDNPHFVVYRLADAILGRFIPLKCIGDNSLFITNSRSLCISSNADTSIVGDSVVRMNHSSMHLAKYHLRSGTWSTATDSEISRGPIPSPYSLIHHIFTCCHRRYWNKGQIYSSGINLTWGVKAKWRIGG